MPIYGKFKMRSFGENALLVEVSDEISVEANEIIIDLNNRVKKTVKGIVETVPAYTTLLVIYNPLKINFEELTEKIREEEEKIRKLKRKRRNGRRRIVEIPVIYGGEFGPDLKDIAEHAGISVEEVVKIHSNRIYRVYMIGFIPGFPYMGEVSEKIAAPRLKNPRLRVPAGSVGIAGKQTGIYPFESPGGWRIIGRTPIRLFNHEKKPPTLLKVGDHVKFRPIEREEYNSLLAKSKMKIETEKFKGIPALKVLAAGPGVTIQDLGRSGYREYGVPSSGALDLESLIYANILVGNNISSACIEIFQSSIEMEALENIVIAITGAEVEGEIDGEKIREWEAIPIRKGGRLSIHSMVKGVVAYISIAGGISEPIILGSRSHYLRGKIGRRIRENSTIYLVKNRFEELVKVAPARRLEKKTCMDSGELRVMPGPHEEIFKIEAIDEFYKTEFKVSSSIDRMGYRLEAEKPKYLKGVGRMISCGTIPGAIQIPPDGNPIVLMMDAQTTGGYPIIGKLIIPDLWRISQMEPGKKINFKKINRMEALKILREKEEEFKRTVSRLDEECKRFLKEFEHLTVKYEEKILDCWLKKL